jgi:hypothetical protein
MVDGGGPYASYDPGTSSGDTPPITPADGGADQSSTEGTPAQPPPPAQAPDQSSSSDTSSQTSSSDDSSSQTSSSDDSSSQSSSSDTSSQSSSDGGVCADPDQSPAPAVAPPADPPAADNGASSTPADGDNGAVMTPAVGVSTPPPSASTEDIPVWPHAVLQLTPEDVAPEIEPTEPQEEKEEPNNAFQINYSGRLLEPIEWTVKYGKLTGQLEGKVSGTVTPKEATYTSGWDKGIFTSFAKEFKWGDWTSELEIKLGKPVEEKEEGKEEKKYLVEVEISGKTSREWSAGTLLDTEVSGEAEVELAASFIKIGKPRDDDNASWKPEAPEAKASVSGSTTGKYDLTDWGYPGTFDGTFGIEASLTFESDYTTAIEDLIKDWGEELTCDVAADLVLAFSTVAGGVAAIVVNWMIILEGDELESMRSSTIPALTSSATQGFMDGVSGSSQGDSTAQITDPDHANAAGAAAGAKKRSEVISNKCGGDASMFDNWLQQGTNKQDVENAARASIQATIEESLWVAKAKEYAGSMKRKLPGGDGMTLHDQYMAWVYICGDSPASRGGKWLQTWLEYRIEDSDEPDRSAGNW